MSFYDKLKDGLSKTRDSLSIKLDNLVLGSVALDDDFVDEIEMILLTADVGTRTVHQIMTELRLKIKNREITIVEMVKPYLEKIVYDILAEQNSSTELTGKPHVIFLIGVNGAGKTTTIGKLANFYREQGKKVLLGAADTFRAAAIEQLEEWAKRAKVDVIKQKEGSDPAAVAFDTVKAGIARGADVIFIDTAGRLQTKSNLMEELKKIRRVVARELPGAPHETLMVLDGTTGQNAISQAKLFSEAALVTGLVLTKIDGTAKGGAVLAVKNELGIPVKWVGVGEGIDDLRPFVPEEYARALFEK
ncbi:MAG: signal recognition particle-docking protein FtsY [Negativicutes bacterium]|jgi:fused signal recognition particle receptor